MAHFILFSFAPASIWLQILLLVAGIGVVLWGADKLTSGAVGIASRLGIPQIIIGLTIVAAGTSAPEFFVSLLSAINGTADLAVGNVVGSNIFNTLLIVGCTAMVAPIAILRVTIKRDIPFAILASVALMVMCIDNNISRVDAAVLFILFVGFMWITLRGARKDESVQIEATATEPVGAVKATLMIIIGLGCLVLGSNVFTILAILGLTGLVQPMSIQGISMVDLSMLILSVVLLWLFSFTKYRVQRWEGAVMAAIYVAYMCWLIAGV